VFQGAWVGGVQAWLMTQIPPTFTLMVAGLTPNKQIRGSMGQGALFEAGISIEELSLGIPGHYFLF
jgi:hypothetical protein